MKRFNNNFFMPQERHRPKSTTGFTLIEILVVFGLISLLAGSLILYGRKSEKLLLMFKDQVRVVSALQKAKSFALGAYGQQNAPCGYGVHFNDLNATPPNSFVIFQDLPVGGATCAASADRVLTAGNSEEIVETLFLDKLLEFEAPVLSDVVYIPPAPDVILSIAPNSTTTNAVISVKISGSNEFRRVKVTDSGQITPLNNQ